MPDDKQRAIAAETLALDFPSDMALLQVWVERASWAGVLEPEIRARARWLAHQPVDLENRPLGEAVDRIGEALEKELGETRTP